ncbi:MAG: hypothetical protein K9J37_00065 [Saprospiraceae bacterium]|nr:hypothetical protein [Saprospiraceae bacterium]MCF8248266.1 hypothetical protein [Saprospiraceae bacterium]MCF8279980.1 hypothetical protein [Bacteroidales bacterium]MCF8309794.1 hypothetical protein [Saprospiraceae bacterium]MCF8438875.1 hypothetical protein [Saprospiraceae bacterium]
MKWTLTTLLIWVQYSILLAQNELVIPTENGSPSNKVANGIIEAIDTTPIFQGQKILDHLIFSDRSIGLITEEFDGVIFYKKYFLNSKGFWEFDSMYCIGYFPTRSMYVPGMQTKPFYKLTSEDVIEATVRGEKSIVDLVALEKLGCGVRVVHPKD